MIFYHSNTNEKQLVHMVFWIKATQKFCHARHVWRKHVFQQQREDINIGEEKGMLLIVINEKYV